MKTILRNALAVATLATAITPSQSQAAIAYTISTGSTLVRFDTATPGVVTTVGNFTGAVSSLDSIDFRAVDGQLYGYSFLDNAVVRIDRDTGFTSLVATPSVASITFDLGIDFNPMADRLRLVNSNDQNLRINVAGGATIMDGPLTYAAGDPNFGINPTINEAAYTNNDVSLLTGTQIYYVDYALGTLVTTATPNAGVINTVGSLGLGPITSFTGFDIFTDPFSGTNTAFAILSTNALPSALYTINLTTGAATPVGGIGSFPDPIGLAVIAAVPEPGTALAGLVAFGICATRRRRAAQA